MARPLKRNEIAVERNVIALRAGSALERLIPAPHRDKAIARLFGVSVRMAVYLRAGQHWTLDRLAEASAKLGSAFDVLLWQPEADVSAAREISAEAEDRIVERIARRVREDAGVAAALLALETAGDRSGEARRSLAVVRPDAPKTAPMRRRA